MAPVAITYGRVSSEQQAGEKQTSLQDQRTTTTQLAARLGAPIVEAFEDAGISGATVAKRPAFRALLAYVEANPRTPSDPGFVLALNDSRFGRFDDPDEAAALRFQCRQHGWLVRFAESDDSEDPTARHVMRAIGSATASAYRHTLKANSVRGRSGTVAQGYWATKAPFGYRRAVVYPASAARVLDHGQCKARGEKIKLTPGPELEVAIVQELFARYASGAYSLHGLCRWLATEPAATAGRQPWHTATVRNVLENHAYLGAIPARRRTAARMAQGDFTRHAPESITWDAHPALVSPALFDLVQEQLTKSPPRAGAFDYRLRGLVTCAACGLPLMGGGLGALLARTGARMRFYICAGGRATTCRPAACVKVELLETAAIEALVAHVRREVAPDVLEAAIRARVASAAPARDAKKAKAHALQRRERLLGAIEAGIITLDAVGPRLAAIDAELAQPDTTPVDVPDALARRHHLDRIVARGRELLTLATAATGPELRALLRPWVDTMIFDRTTRTLTLELKTLRAALAGDAQAGRRTPQPNANERRVITVAVTRKGA